MGINTGIAWTDSTFNPWIGCTKIGPGCDNCYAEAADHRFYNSAHWGAGAPRKRTSEANWKKPLQWNRAAQASGRPHRVFCASQADVFDNEIDPQWRADLWALIRATPFLTWQLVTKRVGNIDKMLPPDWTRSHEGCYPNVWLIITVVNQEEADRDIPKLTRVPAIVRGLSVEPQIGPINLAQAGLEIDLTKDGLESTNLHWIIIGGESAQFGKCREFNLVWAADLIAQCHGADVAVFMKQLGSKPTLLGEPFAATGKGDEPDEWPIHLRIRQFPVTA